MRYFQKYQRKQSSFLTLLMFLSFGIPSHAVAHSFFEERVTPSVSDGRESFNRVGSFAWENDLYYRQDYYYTNGFRFDLFHEKIQRSPIQRILFPLGKKEEGVSCSGLQLRQEIFTPKDLAADTISYGDHPYASTLTLAQISVYNLPDRKMRVVSELRLGLLGPASLGSRTQKLAHLVSNPSRPPQGWEYQLHNDLILNYMAGVEKGFLQIKNAFFGLRGSGRLGTQHTDMESGLWFRFDARHGYFNRFGPSGEPGFNLLLFFSVNTRYVLYDATLQGGLFNKSSPYKLSTDELMRWVRSIEGSVTLEWINHQFEIYTRLASPRFYLAESHGWIGMAYKYWF